MTARRAPMHWCAPFGQRQANDGTPRATPRGVWCRRSVRSGRVRSDRRPRRRIARTRGARTRGRGRRVRIAPCVVEPRSRPAGKSSLVAPRPAAPSSRNGTTDRAVVSETTPGSAAGTSLWLTDGEMWKSHHGFIRRISRSSRRIRTRRRESHLAAVGTFRSRNPREIDPQMSVCPLRL